MTTAKSAATVRTVMAMLKYFKPSKIFRRNIFGPFFSDFSTAFSPFTPVLLQERKADVQQ